MNASTGRRLGIALIALAVVALVAIGAYGLGVSRAANGNAGPFFGRMGYMMDFGYGYGLLGSILFVALIVAIVWLVVTPRWGPRYYGPSGTGGGPEAPGPGSSGSSGVDQLRQLADLHDRGQLTDEEFAAAKRRLLGL